MSTTKIAVVTGANKGIGYAIVKGLCEKFNGKVYLTARDEGRGAEAVKKLQGLGLNPVFYQLDISDQASINKFRDHIVETDGGIDILINNAAIAYKGDDVMPLNVQAENIIATNYFGTLHVCEILFPVLRSNAQVVNMSSSVGHLSRISNSELRAKFENRQLTISQLSDLMNMFLRDVKDGKNEWGTTAYSVSKVGVSALTFILQRSMDSEVDMRNISVNCVHPGLVNTDMITHNLPLTIGGGSVAPLFVALQPHGWKGQFVWHNSTIIDWYAADSPARS